MIDCFSFGKVRFTKVYQVIYFISNNFEVKNTKDFISIIDANMFITELKKLYDSVNWFINVKKSNGAF